MFANGARMAAFASLVSSAANAATTSDEVTIGTSKGSRGEVDLAVPQFYDDNGNPLNVHMSVDEALQAGETSPRAAASASGTKNEYGVATIKGHVAGDGAQTYYNSVPITSNHPTAIRFSTAGIQKSLVAINHLHPSGYRSRPSSGDRAQYKALVKDGYSELRGIYSFGGSGNYRHGPRSPGWFGRRTFSCGADWNCPTAEANWKR